MDFKRLVIIGERVTPQEVENAILKVEYTKLGSKMTIAHVTLVDGFEVVGKSGVVNPAMYDIKIGGPIALENAKVRVWEHMGSILQDRLLSKSPEDYMNRLIIEKDELEMKLILLNRALINKTVPESAVESLTRQSKAMEVYFNILIERIG